MVRNTEKELSDACMEAIELSLGRLATAYANGNVYAFVILVDSGYGAIAFAYGAKSELQEKRPDETTELEQLLANHPDLMEIANSHRKSEFYTEVNAVEWNNEIDLSEYLLKTNEIIAQIMSDDSQSNPAEFVESILLKSILELRNSKHLMQPAFTDDMLLGIQFPDPLPDEIASVLRISRVVNSNAWHEKMVDGYGI